MDPQELVLVVPTAVLHEVGLFQGFCAQVERYLPRLLDTEVLRFLPRGEVEEDPGYKQLIPYVLFCWRSPAGETHLFHYRRGTGQGESRLHALRSVGVGGHINPVDTTGQEAPFQAGRLREIEEEVLLDKQYPIRTVGLINDDATPVGQVHLGVVSLVQVDSPQSVRPRESELLDCGFAPVGELLRQAEEFETWSQISMRALWGQAAPAGSQA